MEVCLNSVICWSNYSGKRFLHTRYRLSTKTGSHPTPGGYKYRGLVLRDGGWAWG